MGAIIREVTIGPCRLIQGDCLEVLPLIGKVDAVVTDPPYGINFAAQPTKWQRRAGQLPEQWDDRTISIVTTFPELSRECVIWGGNYYPLPPTRGWLSWFKPDSPPSMASIELAWTSKDMNSRQISHSISATNAERVGHPTQKPIAVMQWTIRFVEGETILDPFMGSGTTGVACIKTGRNFIGVEKEPKYFDIACNRIRRAWQDKCSEIKFDEPEPMRQLLLTDATTEPTQ